MTATWRPPKKKNKRAWARVDNGDRLWDHKAVERAAVRRLRRLEAWNEYRKAIRHHKLDVKKGIEGPAPMPPQISHKGNNR